MTSRHVIISIRTHIREDQLLTRKQYTTRTKQKNISPYGAHGVGQRHWEIRFVSGKKSFPLRETNGHFVLRCLYEEWKIREQRNRKKAGTKKSFIRPSWYREMSCLLGAWILRGQSIFDTVVTLRNTLPEIDHVHSTSRKFN